MVLPSPPCFPPPSTSVTLCVSSRSSAAGWKEVEVGGWVVEASRVEEREAARTTSGGSRGEGGWWGAEGSRWRGSGGSPWPSSSLYRVEGGGGKAGVEGGGPLLGGRGVGSRGGVRCTGPLPGTLQALCVRIFHGRVFRLLPGHHGGPQDLPGLVRLP